MTKTLRVLFLLTMPIGLPVLAQTASDPGSRQRSDDAATPIYRSPLATYRPFKDQPVLDWREVNETVRRNGGWQSYAREAQAAQSSATGDQVQPAGTPPKNEK